jgi:hypothetical protein
MMVPAMKVEEGSPTLIESEWADQSAQSQLRARVAEVAPRVEVDVNGGNAILRGHFQNEQERKLALAAAWCAEGVHKVLDLTDRAHHDSQGREVTARSGLN